MEMSFQITITIKYEKLPSSETKKSGIPVAGTNSTLQLFTTN